jgi:hypothetical protein
MFLRFIIDNYDKLPDHVLFIHPNRYQWHNDDPDYDGLPMLRHFQLPNLEKEGYVNIRCAWTLGCPNEIKPFEEEGENRAAVHAGGSYKRNFELLFPELKVPEKVGVSCCAQFAATKEKIRERKKEDYLRYREWLLKTELDDNISGRILEYSWHSKFRDLNLFVRVRFKARWAQILRSLTSHSGAPQPPTAPLNPSSGITQHDYTFVSSYFSTSTEATLFSR